MNTLEVSLKEHSGRDEVLATSFGLLSASEEVQDTIPPLRVVEFVYVIPYVVFPTSFLEQVGRSFEALATSLPPEHFQAIATEERGPDSGLAVTARMQEHQLRAFYMANPETLTT
ncbi:MAG: hypothetical protein H8D78_07760 [Chloroflexi bacterium]|nr:hypothetical protein [Chloroflexota bacterium]